MSSPEGTQNILAEARDWDRDSWACDNKASSSGERPARSRLNRCFSPWQIAELTLKIKITWNWAHDSWVRHGTAPLLRRPDRSSFRQKRRTITLENSISHTWRSSNRQCCLFGTNTWDHISNNSLQIQTARSEYAFQRDASPHFFHDHQLHYLFPSVTLHCKTNTSQM